MLENWDFFEPDEEETTITLRYHTGKEKDVFVYGQYRYNDKIYKTKLADDSSGMFDAYNKMNSSWNPDRESNNNVEIESITFDKSIDTSNVTNMNSMFANCINLTELDVSMFNTSNVTSMANMFDGLHSLERLDLSNFDTSKVTDMAYMFQNDENLEWLDLSSFNTGALSAIDNPDSLAWMFEGCIKMKEIRISNSWTITEGLAERSEMFKGNGIYGNEHTSCNILYNQLTNIDNLPKKTTVEDLTGLYDAAAGKWVGTEELKNIRPYGQCKDHKNGILGVEVTDGDIDHMNFYWVNSDGTISPNKVHDPYEVPNS